MEPPPADWEVDDRTVRELVRRQLPSHADAELVLVAQGFDAWIYRLGDDLAVRLPRRHLSAPKIAVEQRWLPVLARLLPVPVPEPVLAGRPEPGVFAHRWTISAWLPGVPAAEAPPAPTGARQLGELLAALHRPAPADAPANPFRDGALAQRWPDLLERAERVRERYGELRRLVDDALTVLERSAQRPGEQRTWIHGDLHPFNLLVDDGRLSGVIDWIDLTAGDPALDAHTVWWFWPADEQTAFWEVYPHDPDRRERSRGWAVFFGLLFLDAGGDDPAWRTWATRILDHAR